MLLQTFSECRISLSEIRRREQKAKYAISLNRSADKDLTLFIKVPHLKIDPARRSLAVALPSFALQGAHAPHRLSSKAN
jgi:hypothetical protein